MFAGLLLSNACRKNYTSPGRVLIYRRTDKKGVIEVSRVNQILSIIKKIYLNPNMLI